VACAERKKVRERRERRRRGRHPFKAVQRRWGTGRGKTPHGGEEWWGWGGGPARLSVEAAGRQGPGNGGRGRAVAPTHHLGVCRVDKGGRG
jgi:hypothetical protein